MKRRHVFLLGAGLLCAVAVAFYVAPKLPAKPITRAFAAIGIKKVVVRAANAKSATVHHDGGEQIQITGLPTGGAEGYHSSDPFWRETPAKNWGLDFLAKRYSDLLIISTKKEIEYIHHYYVLEDLSIRVPKGVVVVKEERKLSGDGAPDLRKP